MRLERNITLNGSCKYSLIENLKGGTIEHGRPGTEGEFFVIKLKDINARDALIAYAASVVFNNGGVPTEYSDDILELSERAGDKSKFCKEPD